MALAAQAKHNATFVGIGFGAIQAGLFALEAYRADAFRHLVIAEIMPEIVAAVRRNGGYYRVNVAHADRVEHVRVGPVVMENPTVRADRARLVEAIANAQEIATAVPSVRAYTTRGPASVHRLLAAGLERKAAIGGPRAVVYAAENHSHAAELLRNAVMEETHEAERSAVGERVRFVDTVIGKLCGIINSSNGLEGLEGLEPITPGSDRAFLVEAFNHILIARPDFEPITDTNGEPLLRGLAIFGDPLVRGLAIFEEKDDLQPFEEAKFYAHNSVHALGAYLGLLAGAQNMAQLAQLPGMAEFLRAAVMDEAAPALLQRYGDSDLRFTHAGFAAYIDDFLARMVNPYLRDALVRIACDPERKLGWEDRLIGAMRLSLHAGGAPRRYALGVAAALHALDAIAEPALLLPAIWQQAQPDPTEMAAILALVQTAHEQLRAWCAAGMPDISAWWQTQTV